VLIGRDLARNLDPVLFATDCGIPPDGWQADLLRSSAPRALLLCSRQSGKTTTTSLIALHCAVYIPGALVVVVSPSQRQSAEMLRTIKLLHMHLDGAPALAAPLWVAIRQISMVERTELKVTTIGAFDCSKSDRAEERRRKKNEAKRIRRAQNSTGRARGRPRKTGIKNAGTPVDAYAVPAFLAADIAREVPENQNHDDRLDNRASARLISASDMDVKKLQEPHPGITPAHQIAIRLRHRMRLRSVDHHQHVRAFPQPSHRHWELGVRLERNVGIVAVEKDRYRRC
jgi:hypothetical protein